MLSNGPGDPRSLGIEVETIRELVRGEKPDLPMFGICLGHQLLGLAVGGETYKLKFGHRGANHPVKDLTTGKVHITSVRITATRCKPTRCRSMWKSRI